MNAEVVGSLVAGALSWTLLEYWLHRGLGHGARFRKNPFALEHTRHHSEGDFFAASWKKLLAAALAAAAVALPAVSALGAARGGAFVAGLIGFYGVYEVLHRLNHVWAGWGPYGRWARRHHFAHHFVDPRCNHGVTSPLWDLVFGTYRRVDVIAVPKKLCMQWLLDAGTGAIRAEWAGTYRLR